MQKWYLSKFAHLANTKNDIQQIAYLASMRCKSMSKNAFQILQTVHLVKTQKRHCQICVTGILNVQKRHCQNLHI